MPRPREAESRATSRPLFVSAHWLGALFLAVGVGPDARAGLPRVMRVISVALAVELAALALLMASIRAAGSAGVNAALNELLIGPYSVPFWLGAVFLGAVLPLVIQPAVLGSRASRMIAVRAVLVLAGGFLVKYILLSAGQVTLNGGAG